MKSGRGYPENLLSWHDFGWAHSYLADDLSSTPVSSWADGQGGVALTEATNQPAWSASSGPNSQPGVTFDGSNDTMATSAFAASVTQPYSVVCIYDFVATPAGNRAVWDGIGSANRGMFYANNSGTWSFNAGGSTLSGGTHDLSAHTATAYVNGASTVVEIDGTSTITGNPGTDTLTGLRTGSRYDGTDVFGNVVISAIGVYSGGDARSDGSWSALVNYVASKWGLTL